jgi:O-succinylbenzoic acid--CoA ligase
MLAHLKSAQSVLVGGAKLDQSLLTQALDAGISIVRTYGMSETSGGCIYEGTPLKGVDLRLTDAGLIEISGAVLASGYIGNNELWSQIFDGQWFTTPDRGEIASDGTLRVLGRADDVYVTGGEKVSLVQVDEILSQAFASHHWCSVAVEDAQWGQRLVIAVGGADHPALDQINSELEMRIGGFAKAKQLLTFDQLPTIGIGKIDRAQIIQQAEEIHNG